MNQKGVSNIYEFSRYHKEDWYVVSATDKLDNLYHRSCMKPVS